MNTHETFSFRSRHGLHSFLVAIRTGFKDDYDVMDKMPAPEITPSLLSYSVTLDMSKL